MNTTTATTPARPRHLTRTVCTLAAAVLIVGIAAAPSSARQDAGPVATHTTHDGQCTLERIQTQFVRCDNLTGNGVPAPAYIPRR